MNGHKLISHHMHYNSVFEYKRCEICGICGIIYARYDMTANWFVITSCVIGENMNCDEYILYRILN